VGGGLARGIRFRATVSHRGTRNGGQMPVGHLFEVTFPGLAWLNGGDLGTEASVFICQPRSQRLFM